LIVVDASVMVHVLLGSTEHVDLIAELLLPSSILCAPDLLDLEVAQAFRGLVRAGEIDDARGGEMLEDLAGFPIERYPHDLLLPRIWELRSNFSAYDAAYVALTEGLGGRLATRDARLATACRELVEVELV
jgi:predicted nucleic acid-binding protein